MADTEIQKEVSLVVVKYQMWGLGTQPTTTENSLIFKSMYTANVII